MKSFNDLLGKVLGIQGSAMSMQEELLIQKGLKNPVEGNMKGMEDLLRQAQLMQNKMAEMQTEMAQKTVEGSSGGGMVRVTCTGKQAITNIAIDKSAVDPEDIDMLQDLVMAAVNDALRQSEKLMESTMSSLTAGLTIPGMPKI